MRKRMGVRTMQRLLRLCGLLLTLALLIPLLAVEAKQTTTKKDTDKDKDKSPTKEKLIPVQKGVVAKINRVDAENQVLHVEIGRTYLEIVPSDDVAVRTKNPPSSFDAKGNIVTKPSAEELKKIRDAKTNTYFAEFTSLKAGQIVQLNLARLDGVASAKTPPMPKKTKDKDKDKDKKDNQPDVRLRFTWALIVQDVP
jgi:hypothetical protein